MNEHEVISIPGDKEQLKKYAEDLSAVYRSEKRKREELEAANEQLVEARNEVLKREKALEESRECYRSLVENIPVGVFRFHLSDPEKLAYANSALAKINDDVIDRLMSQPVSSFFADKDVLNMLISNTINDGSINSRLARLKRTDGKLIWCSISAICHYDKSGEPEWIQGVIEDVTERVEIENKLSKYFFFLESLINTIGSPVFYKNASGVYLGCNKAFAEEIIGVQREQIINKTFSELSDRIPDYIALANAEKKDNELLENPGIQIYESPVKCADGKTRFFHFNKSTFSTPDGELAGVIGIMVDVTERIEKERKLARINDELNLLVSSMSSIIIGVSVKDRITHWNPYAEKLLGLKASDTVDKVFCECNIKWEWGRIYEGISQCILDDRLIRLDDIIYEKPNGKNGILGLTVTPLKHEDNILEGFLVLGRDLTEQRFMEQQLMQGSKLEAIGQLAAGVAHEINTPLQYVGDNIRFITKSFAVLLSILDIYQRASANYNDREFFLQRIREIDDISEKEMFSFILDELPGAIDQSLEGIEKVSSIVQSMKAFSHPGIGRKVPADINRSIENTVTVSRNEWKYDCELKLELDYNLPEIPCYESELNQVILNLIVNAADAIHENFEKGNIDKGVIIISTFREEYNAIITISDNGGGIPEDIRDKIFNPFFTTKDVGKGTGQGLPLSFSIIHEKHSGTLSYETEMGEGTTFIIKLPLEDE